jgi:protein TonB
MLADTLAGGESAHARRRSLAVASVAAHVALGVGLFGYSILHIEELAPPSMALTFFATAPPPPPPPPPAGHKAKTTPKVEVKPTPTPTSKLVQPMKDPPHEEKKDEPAEAGGVDGGVKGGVAGGVVGGTVGGVVGGTGTQPKMVASFTLAAQQLQHKDPQLPDWFMNQHAKQKVTGKYKVCIRQDGGISDVTAVVGIPAVDDGIIQQIKNNWLYKPQPVPVCTLSVINFTIN